MTALQRLLADETAGDPMSGQKWTRSSLRRLSQRLTDEGYPLSPPTVGRLLESLGYALRVNTKQREARAGHPERDRQFASIGAQRRAFQATGQPVISVDTKKQELVGDCKNGGREWHPQGTPEAVRMHDFALPELGRVRPYGVDDLAANAGWVSVGVDRDTAAFAVASIRRWWQGAGRARYPEARRLLITADGGGSNGARVRLWQWALQQLADETGLTIGVCHLPPGTSKWNTIEHRLCSFITQNWRGKPLVSYAVILNLIAATTSTGLTVERYLDTATYPAGRKVTDAEMNALWLERDPFHGEWNYTLAPRVLADENVIS